MWFTISTVVGKGLNLCIFDMFDHTCSGLKKSKLLWVFAYGLSYLQVVKTGPNLCIYNNFNHTCSGLKKSFNWFSHLVYRIYSGQRRFKFVYLSNVIFSDFFMGFHYQWFGKGLNLCILDMFDHTCSGQKKVKFLCTNGPRICSLLLCSFLHVV